MTPNEIKVLNMAEKKDKVSKRKVAGLLGISTDYAGYILERLTGGGYLAMIDKGMYALLPKGVDALLSQLYFAESKLEADIARVSIEKERVRKEIKRLSAHKRNLITT
ncbi:MAG: hypothetical protein KKG62_01220 [Actinobacteria bacterium]|nr:hypothetical protein [Actinomycetota bacterium]